MEWNKLLNEVNAVHELLTQANQCPNSHFLANVFFLMFFFKINTKTLNM